eukprot:SAG22_NODE_13107_length_418_cov_63.545455_2_plen_44_part_01
MVQDLLPAQQQEQQQQQGSTEPTDKTPDAGLLSRPNNQTDLPAL